MTRASALLSLLAALACNRAAPTAARTAPPDASPPPAPVPDAGPAGPETGYRRLDYLDIDLKEAVCEVQVEPFVVRVGPFGNAFAGVEKLERTEKLPDGEIQVSALIERKLVTVKRTVGTLRTSCTGVAKNAADEACIIETCKSARPVPGGTAAAAWPDGDPVISVVTSGGFTGGTHGGYSVYADGSVQFQGGRCKKWRGGRGKVEPQKLEALFADLEKTGFFKLKGKDLLRGLVGACSDDVYTSVTVKGTTGTLSGCGPNPEPVQNALAAIGAAVGRNPCDYL